TTLLGFSGFTAIDGSIVVSFCSGGVGFIRSRPAMTSRIRCGVRDAAPAGEASTDRARISTRTSEGRLTSGSLPRLRESGGRRDPAVVGEAHSALREVLAGELLDEVQRVAVVVVQRAAVLVQPRGDEPAGLDPSLRAERDPQHARVREHA